MDRQDKSDEGGAATRETGAAHQGLSPVKVLLLFVAALGVLYYAAGSLRHDRTAAVVGFDEDLARACRVARASGKVVFADFHADWCGPCRAMDREVFSRKDFAAALEAMAIPVRIDLDSRAGEALAARYRIAAIPAYVVLDPDGHALAKGEGQTTAQGLLDLVRRAAERAAGP